MAEGNLKNIIETQESITGNYLSGKKFISVPKKRRVAKNGRFLEIIGATGNNLQNLFLLAATISLFLEVFPLKSTGSIFTTNNTTYII